MELGSTNFSPEPLLVVSTGFESSWHSSLIEPLLGGSEFGLHPAIKPAPPFARDHEVGVVYEHTITALSRQLPRDAQLDETRDCLRRRREAHPALLGKSAEAADWPLAKRREKPKCARGSPPCGLCPLHVLLEQGREAPTLAWVCTHRVTRCHAFRPCRTRKDAQLRDETAWALHVLPARLSGGDHDSRYRRSGTGRGGAAWCLAARRSQGCRCCGCDRRPALGERV